jgi:predicted transport protein
MAIYKIEKDYTVSEVKEKPFQLEKEIQLLFEKNLTKFTGLQLVKTEFSIKNKRIDTLAFDMQSNAFVIIEYKRSRHISVVDQGFTYLSLMLENKADFIIDYNEQLNANLKRTDIDWSQSRVVFVSPEFTDNQIQATNFKDIAIELWQVTRYSNNTIAINDIKKSRSAESIKPITAKNTQLQSVVEEIKVYSEDDHKQKATAETYELYEQFRDAIQNLSTGIELKVLKHYIALKKQTNIVCIELQKKQIKMWLNVKPGQLIDEKGLARDVSNMGHWGTGDYGLTIKDDNNLEYILSLIKQAL